MAGWSDILSSTLPLIIGGGFKLIDANQAKQRAKGEANAIKAEQDKTLEILKQNALNIKLAQEGGQSTSDGKSNTLLYVGLGVGGVLILGLVIFAITRK